MINGTVNLTTQSKTYEYTPTQDESSKWKASVETSYSSPPSNDYMSIDKHVPDSMFCPPKETIQNLISLASQYYNIVEDLAHAPCSISTLEVLQNCPSQRRTLC